MELAATILYFIKLKELKWQFDKTPTYIFLHLNNFKILFKYILGFFIGGKDGHIWFPLLVLLFSFVVWIKCVWIKFDMWLFSNTTKALVVHGVSFVIYQLILPSILCCHSRSIGSNQLLFQFQ
jgi:membrane associated rhomboid family serine protease